MAHCESSFLGAATSIVGVLGGLVAAYMAIVQFRRSTDQRREDLRWRRAEMAKTCVDEIRRDPLANSALKMLDWTGLKYPRPSGGETGQIDHAQRRAALRTTETQFASNDDGPFIRDAFDALFDGFERMEHLIRIDLIEFADVGPPFRYYVKKLASSMERAPIEAFLVAYEFDLASRFLGRFDEWKAGEGHAESPA
jgi:hypothetical protein